jgi:hypothetical protein
MPEESYYYFKFVAEYGGLGFGEMGIWFEKMKIIIVIILIIATHPIRLSPR